MPTTLPKQSNKWRRQDRIPAKDSRPNVPADEASSMFPRCLAWPLVSSNGLPGGVQANMITPSATGILAGCGRVWHTEASNTKSHLGQDANLTDLTHLKTAENRSSSMRLALSTVSPGFIVLWASGRPAESICGESSTCPEKNFKRARGLGFLVGEATPNHHATRLLWPIHPHQS